MKINSGKGGKWQLSSSTSYSLSLPLHIFIFIMEILCFLRARSWGYHWFFSLLHTHNLPSSNFCWFCNQNMSWICLFLYSFIPYIECKLHISFFQNYFCFQPPPQLFSRLVIFKVRATDFRRPPETVRLRELLRSKYFYNNVFVAFFYCVSICTDYAKVTAGKQLVPKYKWSSDTEPLPVIVFVILTHSWSQF